MPWLKIPIACEAIGAFSRIVSFLLPVDTIQALRKADSCFLRSSVPFPRSSTRGIILVVGELLL